MAKQVEVVKKVAAKIYEATTVGTLSGKNFSEWIIATSSPAVAKNSDSNIPFVLLETKEMEVCPKSNVKCANTTAEIAPNICKSEYEINSWKDIFFLKYIIKLTAGLKWAPETFEKIVILESSTRETANATVNNVT